MVIERKEALREIDWRWSVHPALSLIGPRECGKTTLAAAVAAAEPEVTRFDLGNEDDFRRLAERPQQVLAPLGGLVVLDGAHRSPGIYGCLRVLIDRPEATTRYVLVESVWGGIVRGKTQSLIGRVGHFDLSGFDLAEIGGRPGGWRRLWERGGFPRSYLAATAEDSFCWRRAYLRSFPGPDLASVRDPVPADLLRQCWTALARRQGKAWNPGAVGREIGVGTERARQCLALLSGVFAIRLLYPSLRFGKRARARSPRVYVRDSGLLHALLGVSTERELADHPLADASFEGFAIEQVVTRTGAWRADFWSGVGGGDLALVIGSSSRRYGFRTERTKAPRVTRSMRRALSDLGLKRLFVVYPGADRYELDRRIEALPVADLPAILPYRNTPAP